MAFLTVHIPDEVEQELAKSGDPRKVAAHLLSQFQGVKPEDRVLLLNAEQRRALEKVVGLLSNPQQVVDRLEGVMKIRLGGIDIPLSESQKRKLVQGAPFHGMTPEAWTRDRLLEGLRLAVETS